MLRFARMGGQIVAFSCVMVKIGGRGKVPRVKLFTQHEPIARVPPKQFQSMVQDEKIQRLDLPHDLQGKAEDLSDKIGSHYTPQEALKILQGMIQDHATTLQASEVEV